MRNPFKTTVSYFNLCQSNFSDFNLRRSNKNWPNGIEFYQTRTTHEVVKNYEVVVDQHLSTVDCLFKNVSDRTQDGPQACSKPKSPAKKKKKGGHTKGKLAQLQERLAM